MRLKRISGVLFVLIFLLITGTFFSCRDDGQIEFARYYSSGALIYQQHCQNCHGTHGEGLQGLIPPLTDSIYLNTNRKALACAIKFGLKGKIIIHNKQFDGAMPANDLAPIEIAQALTYAGNSFGNKVGIINVDEVNAGLAGCN